ncbi:unnamed protein product [Prorocentrum cordatum]|uniref:Uncharacterized protein n=1 Tax=Prorocentrum cordatum TaxID=2364126 RepID=A0ABN9U563_9DINO|nr:unnamed protein product [Polarella glacialis]
MEKIETGLPRLSLLVDALAQAAGRQAEEAKRATEENGRLRQQVAQLDGEGQRAGALQDQIARLRAGTAKSAAREAQLLEQMARLRELKDSYSAEYEDEHQQGEAWEEKAEDLDKKLQAALGEKESLRRTQQAALERVRSARAEEDEFFEENDKLQKQNEALAQRLRDKSAAANGSSEEARSLSQQVQELQASEASDEQNSHAAWVANERELMQARRDLQAAVALQTGVKAELLRTRAVLDPRQRQLLGTGPKWTLRPIAFGEGMPNQVECTHTVEYTASAQSRGRFASFRRDSDQDDPCLVTLFAEDTGYRALRARPRSASCGEVIDDTVGGRGTPTARAAAVPRRSGSVGEATVGKVGRAAPPVEHAVLTGQAPLAFERRLATPESLSAAR